MGTGSTTGTGAAATAGTGSTTGTGTAATAGAGSATGAGTGVGSGISTGSGARAGAGRSRTPALSAAGTIAVPVIASGATGFAAFTITRLGIVGSGGSSAALVGTASATRDSATAGSGVTSTGTTTGATTTGTAATVGTGSTTGTGAAATTGAGSTTGTGSGSNGGGAVSIARMVSTGIASADSGTGKAAICTGSDGANVISNIGSADGRTVGELVRTATCESTRRRVSACGSGSIVSRMTTGCARTGVIGGGAVGGADEHAANATHVVSAVNGSSVSKYFIECEHRW